MLKVLSVPSTVFLEITQQCNLSCLHCSATAGTRAFNELSTQELMSCIKYLAKKKVFTVIITGGEPLIKADFFLLIDEIRKNQSVILNTNATLVNEEVAKRLYQSRIKVISVSLDGASPQIHDTNRGLNAFENAIRGIEMLVKNNCLVNISTVVTKINYHDLENVARLAKSLKVDSIGFAHMHPCGRGKSNQEKLIPSLEEDKWIGAEIERIKSIYGKFVNSWYLDQIKLYNARPKRDIRSKKLLPCDAGKKTVAITSWGDIIPCTNLRSLVCGNIRKNDFVSVWQTSPVLTEFRDISNMEVSSIKGCETCDLVSVCAGGCRADAYNQYGSLTAPYPFCRQNTYI